MPSSSAMQVAGSRPSKTDQIWAEPLDTPGYIPRHLKRTATAQFPILEVIQRILYRLTPHGGDLEKLLALIGLYQAIRPAYRHLKQFCIWAFTVQVTIPENDPVAKEVLAWMGSEVLLKSHTRNAMLVTGGLQDANDDFHRRMVSESPYFPSDCRACPIYVGALDNSRQNQATVLQAS
jgi:chaperone BCS1